MLTQFPGYAKVHLGGTESVVTLLLVVFAIGVGLGSLLCERLSAQMIEIGLVPFGSIGLTLFILDLSAASPTNATSLLSQPESWRILADLVSIGVLGGFYYCPALCPDPEPVRACASLAHHRSE